MALAKKCDRCGGYFDKNSSGYNQVLIDNSFTLDTRFKSFDVCPTCMELFMQWMNDEAVIVPVAKGEDDA